LLKRGPFSWR